MPADAVVPAEAQDLLQDDDFDVEITSSETVYRGAVWNIKREEFRYGDSTIAREFVDHTGAVAVLVQDDEGRILLIKQYRHPVHSRDWELPAGLLDVDGEPPLEAAKRELGEEADLEASKWQPLVAFNSTPGGSNERLFVFHATGVTDTESAFEREAEEADIEKRWVALDEVVLGVLEGRLHNSILSISALALHAKLGR
ncbi:NUDIX hydrolase [Frondihabitans peucedani]|uniref:NUDIX hydrolase n=1 Tax=Frondihabitans peucedani TaxID=598626 RepID=A0ABP8DWV0_9MICO